MILQRPSHGMADFEEWAKAPTAPRCLYRWADQLIELGASWETFKRDPNELVQDLKDSGIPLLAARDIVRLCSAGTPYEYGILQFEEWVKAPTAPSCLYRWADQLIELGATWVSFQRNHNELVQDLKDSGIPLLAARDIVRLCSAATPYEYGQSSADAQVAELEGPQPRVLIVVPPEPDLTGGGQIPNNLFDDSALVDHTERTEADDRTVLVDQAEEDNAADQIPTADGDRREGGDNVDLQVDLDENRRTPHLNMFAELLVADVTDEGRSNLIAQIPYSDHGVESKRGHLPTSTTRGQTILENGTAGVHAPTVDGAAESGSKNKGLSGATTDIDSISADDCEDQLELKLSMAPGSCLPSGQSTSPNSSFCTVDDATTDSSEEQNSQAGAQPPVPNSNWECQVESLRKVICDEQGQSNDSVLKSRVGGKLRECYPSHFPDRESVRNFFSLAIERRVVYETGDGPFKMLTWPSESQVDELQHPAKKDWDDQVELLRKVIREQGKGNGYVLKSLVGVKLREDQRFPNRKSLQNFFSWAIEIGIVCEKGSGPKKMLSLPSDQQSKASQTMKVSLSSPVSLASLPARIKSRVEKLPYLHFVLWQSRPDGFILPLDIVWQWFEKWAILMFPSFASACQAIDDIVWLKEGTLVDTREIEKQQRAVLTNKGFVDKTIIETSTITQGDACDQLKDANQSNRVAQEGVEGKGSEDIGETSPNTTGLPLLSDDIIHEDGKKTIGTRSFPLTTPVEEHRAEQLHMTTNTELSPSLERERVASIVRPPAEEPASLHVIRNITLGRETYILKSVEQKSDAKKIEFPFRLKTKLCAKYQKGKCKKGNNCTFAHGQEELRPWHPHEFPCNFKTQLCANHQEGKCPYGNHCTFAHGNEELRLLNAHVDLKGDHDACRRDALIPPKPPLLAEEQSGTSAMQEDDVQVAAKLGAGTRLEFTHPLLTASLSSLDEDAGFVTPQKEEITAKSDENSSFGAPQVEVVQLQSTSPVPLAKLPAKITRMIYRAPYILFVPYGNIPETSGKGLILRRFEDQAVFMFHGLNHARKAIAETPGLQGGSLIDWRELDEPKPLLAKGGDAVPAIGETNIEDAVNQVVSAIQQTKADSVGSYRLRKLVHCASLNKADLWISLAIDQGMVFITKGDPPRLSLLQRHSVGESETTVLCSSAAREEGIEGDDETAVKRTGLPVNDDKIPCGETENIVGEHTNIIPADQIAPVLGNTITAETEAKEPTTTPEKKPDGCVCS